MKKILLLFCIALFSVYCQKGWMKHYAVNIWYVKNNTDQTLILKCPYSDTETPSANPLRANSLEYMELEIAQGARIFICKGMVPLDSKPWFDYYFTKSAEAFGEDVYWQVLTKDGTVLKIWSYSDRNLPDQRFFDESAWSIPHYGIWSDFLFTITDNDLKDI